MPAGDLPFLDITAEGYSTRGPETLAARDESWCARTPYGLAVLRHKDVGQLLRDRRLRQGSHAWPDLQNLEGAFAAFWKRSVIAKEGEDHKLLRHLAMPALHPDYILSLSPDFTASAEEMVRGIGPECEFMEAFSEPFAGRAIATLLGLGKEDAPFIASNAAALGLAMGIGSKRHETVFNAACERLYDLSLDLIARARSGSDKSSFVARLVDQFQQNRVEDDQALIDLIIISIFGGVDTTRAQLGFAVALFIEHPGQWEDLRNDLSLVPNALEEIIRSRPTTTWATREAVMDFEHNGVDIKQGDTLHMLVHASATDPAIASQDGFNIHTKRKMHFGFGGGAHHCLGQFAARTDMACALTVLARNWVTMQWNGVPEWLPDSGNTSPKFLPIKIS